MKTRTFFLALLVAVIIFVLLAIVVEISKAEEKPKQEVKVDTLITLSVPTIDKRINEYKEALDYSVRMKAEAQKTIEQADKNIQMFRIAISVLESIKVDSVLKAPKK